MKIFGPDQNFHKKDRLGESGKSSKAKESSSPVSAKKDAAASSGGVSEKIAVSDLGKEIAKIHEQIKNSPDVRIEKVQELKRKIDDGTYYVNSDQIAGKIIQDILKNG